MGKSKRAPNAATVAPQPSQDMSYPQDIVDPTCSELSAHSQMELRSFLETAHEQLGGWERWRDGVGWSDDSVSGQIPEIGILEAAAKILGMDFYTCAEGDGDGDVGVTADDALVRDALTHGVDGEAGLTPHDLNLVNEWLSYADVMNSGFLGPLFCLDPISLKHRYTVTTGIALDTGVGLGLGGKVKLLDYEIAIGCYVDLEVKAGLVEFSYDNDLGMTWSRTYGHGGGGIGKSCSFKLDIPLFDALDLGGADLVSDCDGHAASDTWKGPGAFSGMYLEVGGTTEVGVVGTVEATVSALNVGDLQFVTAGVCASADGTIGASAGTTQGGGVMTPMGRPSMENSAVRDIGLQDAWGQCAQAPTHDETPGPMVQAFRRNLYFDTKSADANIGEHAGNNYVAVLELVQALQRAAGDYPPDKVAVEVIGHASPRWRTAGPEAADENNDELAADRAEEALHLVRDEYAMCGPDWPVLDVDICRGLPAEQQTAQSEGSKEGLVETGDRENDDQRYRRATVVIRLQRTDWTRRTAW